MEYQKVEKKFNNLQMITKEVYDYWKPQIKQFEKEQFRLSRFIGNSQCPFCNGSKTTPFVRQGKSQNCKECNVDGLIENRRLAELDLL